MIECMTLLERIVVAGCLGYTLYRIFKWLWNDAFCVEGEKDE